VGAILLGLTHPGNAAAAPLSQRPDIVISAVARETISGKF